MLARKLFFESTFL